jgi:hypothetical protein
MNGPRQSLGASESDPGEAKGEAMRSRKLLISTGIVALLTLHAGCESNDITGIEPFVGEAGGDPAETAVEIASMNDVRPALLVKIAAIVDPDGLTRIQQVLGESALADISKNVDNSFYVSMERRNLASGLPFRVFVALYRDEKLRERMGVFTEEALPPNPLQLGLHQIGPPPSTDDPGPPVLTDMAVQYEILGAAASSGGVSYLWRCDLVDLAEDGPDK